MLDQLKRFSLLQKLIAFIGLPCAAIFACSSLCLALSAITSGPAKSAPIQQAVAPQPAIPAAQASPTQTPYPTTVLPEAKPPTPTSTQVVAATPTPAPVRMDTPVPAPQDFQEGQVVAVVDGDTIDVLIDGAHYRIRYILVDTPETHKGVEPFGPEASQANRELVLGKTVRLEKDVSETDRYGRLLRYVYVGDLMINEELLRRGLAQVATFPPM